MQGISPCVATYVGGPRPSGRKAWRPCHAPPTAGAVPSSPARTARPQRKSHIVLSTQGSARMLKRILKMRTTRIQVARPGRGPTTGWENIRSASRVVLLPTIRPKGVLFPVGDVHAGRSVRRAHVIQKCPGAPRSQCSRSADRYTHTLQTLAGRHLVHKY